MTTPPSSSSFSSTQSSTHATAFHVSSSSKSWIIDSGASDHMTGRSSLLSSYYVSLGRDKVKVVDGTLSSIFGKGSVHVSPILSLCLVVHVPKFATNLLSFSCITKDLNCFVTFFLSHCVFQNLDSKEMIGSGWEANGLYLLDANVVQPSSLLVAQSNNSYVANKNFLLQWHKRMSFVLVFFKTFVSTFIFFESLNVFRL